MAPHGGMLRRLLHHNSHESNISRAIKQIRKTFKNPLVIPGKNIGQITEIHSHQQALRQCKNYLSDHFWTRPLIETDDTAEAASRLKEGKLPDTVGVIGSKHCANLYSLSILEHDIHDLKNNLTLFLGIKKYSK